MQFHEQATQLTQKLDPAGGKRVLVISSDLLPYPGLPTVGSGLRAWGIGQGLLARGHEVLFSIPRAALTGREHLAPPELLELAWEHHNLVSVVRSARPDVVVVSNWPLMANIPTGKLGVPVVLDQAGPHLLEREFQNFGDPQANARMKISALQKADFFNCSGEMQFDYFKYWLTQAGWSEAEQQSLTGIIPFSISPDLPERRPDSELSFVYGGVFLPWQDPTNALSVLVNALERRNAGRLLFFGGKHPVYSVNTGIFEPLLANLQRSPRVVTSGIIPYDELISRYTCAHVAVDLMKYNRERELAFTTRTVVYLWCGLPVIYNNYSELSRYIAEYNAGWTLDPEDTAAIAAVIEEIIDNPAAVAERSQNAQRLVREALAWDKTITPIDEFIRRPTVRPHSRSAEPMAVSTLKYYAGEAWFHYKRAGLRGFLKESMTFLKRQF